MILIRLVGLKTAKNSCITGQRKCNIVSLGDHKNVLASSEPAHDILLKSSLVPRPWALNSCQTHYFIKEAFEKHSLLFTFLQVCHVTTTGAFQSYDNLHIENSVRLPIIYFPVMPPGFNILQALMIDNMWRSFQSLLACFFSSTACLIS